VSVAGPATRTTGCTKQHIQLAGSRLPFRRDRARGGRRARARRRARVEHGDPV